jgi:hypothetical protein
MKVPRVQIMPPAMSDGSARLRRRNYETIG